MGDRIREEKAEGDMYLPSSKSNPASNKLSSPPRSWAMGLDARGRAEPRGPTSEGKQLRQWKGSNGVYARGLCGLDVTQIAEGEVTPPVAQPIKSD